MGCLKIRPSEINPDQHRYPSESLNHRRYDLNPIRAKIVLKFNSVFRFETVVGLPGSLMRLQVPAGEEQLIGRAAPVRLTVRRLAQRIWAG
jgi:hypothetical protein